MPRPIYSALRDLIRREWRTEETGTTDPGGRLSFIGFYGDYELRYRNREGRASVVPLTLRGGRKALEEVVLTDA